MLIQPAPWAACSVPDHRRTGWLYDTEVATGLWRDWMFFVPGDIPSAGWQVLHSYTANNVLENTEKILLEKGAVPWVRA